MHCDCDSGPVTSASVKDQSLCAQAGNCIAPDIILYFAYLIITKKHNIMLADWHDVWLWEWGNLILVFIGNWNGDDDYDNSEELYENNNRGMFNFNTCALSTSLFLINCNANCHFYDLEQTQWGWNFFIGLCNSCSHNWIVSQIKSY